MIEGLSPEESRDWMLERFDAELPRLKLADDYHHGRAGEPSVSQSARNEYLRFIKICKSNIVRPVISALTERLHVDGFTHPDDGIAERVWQSWRRSRLPARQVGAYVDAAVKRRSYLLTWGVGEGKSTTTVEDALQMWAVTDPEDPSHVRGAVKRWRDGDYERVNAYLPRGVFRWTRKADAHLTRSQSDKWEALSGDGGFTPSPDGLEGRVPVVPMLNRPDLDPRGLCEVEDLMPIQDRLNTTHLALLIAQENGAIKQRWATGLEMPTDPETGQPIDGADVAFTKFWSNPETDGKFGEFSSTPLQPFLEVSAHFLELAARVKGLPPHQLTAKGEFPSGDALRSAEASVVLYTQVTSTWHGDAIEQAMSNAGAIEGFPFAPADLETRWRNPETRTYGEAADWAVKLAAAGIPIHILLPRLGFSEREIREAQISQVAAGLMSDAPELG